MKGVMKGLIFNLIFAVAFSAALTGARAHEIRPALLKISETSQGPALEVHYDLVWKQPLLDQKRLRIEPVLPAICTQTKSGGPGQVTSTAVIQRWSVVCLQSLTGQTISIAGLERTMVDVFVESVAADGTSQTRVLKPNAPSFVVGGSQEGAAGTGEYFYLGVAHLLSGFDHILFVIALVLLVRTPMTLVKVVTSFTLAHSLTLGLSTFGLVSLSQGAVEAVIALSIMVLGVELANAARQKYRPQKSSAGEPAPYQSVLLRRPWAITFVFGLLHGFGFAGALADIGLPQGTAALALLLFNLGVEVGQLIIVAGVLAILVAVRYLPLSLPAKARHALALAPAYGIGTLAAVWFLERTLVLF